MYFFWVKKWLLDECMNIENMEYIFPRQSRRKTRKKMCKRMCRFRESLLLDTLWCPDREKWHKNRETQRWVFYQIKEEIILIKELSYIRKISEIDDVPMLDLLFYIRKRKIRSMIRKVIIVDISECVFLRIFSSHFADHIRETRVCDKCIHEESILEKHESQIFPRAIYHQVQLSESLMQEFGFYRSPFSFFTA